MTDHRDDAGRPIGDDRFPAVEGGSLWVKIIEMLQQNWAIITGRDTDVKVLFFDDRSRVFDQMTFQSEGAAIEGLIRNGFVRFEDEPEIQEFVSPPQDELTSGRHPNGPIYSSGRYWI